MRVLTSVATLALAWSPLTTNAFVPTSTARNPISLKASTGEGSTTTPCDIPSEFKETPSLVNIPNGANAIRSAVVTNSAGDYVRIDDVIQSSKVAANAPHVVIYLRHMG
mmetsp:Transcript_37942/g.68324  ORF Transcript_37942/g.68324 Transcript_37942/m.68324 type:complete len:109 (-) Transcript_37942:111-437(-)